jgi:hypothetical protein
MAHPRPDGAQSLSCSGPVSFASPRESVAGTQTRQLVSQSKSLNEMGARQLHPNVKVVFRRGYETSGKTPKKQAVVNLAPKG